MHSTYMHIQIYVYTSSRRRIKTSLVIREHNTHTVLSHCHMYTHVYNNNGVAETHVCHPRHEQRMYTQEDNTQGAIEAHIGAHFANRAINTPIIHRHINTPGSQTPEDAAAGPNFAIRYGANRWERLKGQHCWNRVGKGDSGHLPQFCAGWESSFGSTRI